ncbi:MAG: nickel ABC transporter, nickel/metallophore periplasmic binding protein [Epulopiscium sp. Nuni2H_MBin003]|nr:MAG: nickel ABC transporter, nickel/metallophore periplasmic binding protein [Epulopiscium sp. Nuni2H_MBin003]
MRKIFAMLLTSTMLLASLAGCSNSGSSAESGGSTAQSGGQTTSGSADAGEGETRKDLTFAFFRGMESLSPHTTAGEMWFQEMVYETLVSVENSGIEPCLAESWDISEDGLTYTFKIREGVTFTDGVELDAHVVEFNFDNIWQDSASLQWLESLLLTESYRAVDDYTFEIVLTDPYYPLLTELGLARPYGMGSPNIFIPGEPRNVTGAVGTGPYRLVEDKQDEYVLMTMNENYWGPKPTIENITMRVIPENQTRIMALENGEIDLIYGVNVLDAATLEIYKDSDKIHYALSEPTLTKHIVLNSTVPGLDDQAVRYAINHAVDKEAIAYGIYYGIEQPANALFPPNAPYCDIDLPVYDYNVDKANQLLDDAGWAMGSDGIRSKDGIKLSFNGEYDNNSVTCKPVMELMQANLKTIGIELNLKGYERATYFDVQKSGNFEIVMGVPWGQPYDPHTSLSAFRTPAYGDYKAITGLDNADEIFQTITDFLIVVDENERIELITKVLEDIHEAAVHVPLIYESNKALFTSELKEVTFAPSPYTFPFWDFKY